MPGDGSHARRRSPFRAMFEIAALIVFFIVPGPYVGNKADFRKTGSHLNLGCLRNLRGEPKQRVERVTLRSD